MKALGYYCGILLFLIGCVNQKENLSKNNDYHGPVKGVTIRYFNAIEKFGEIHKEGIKNFEYLEYDKRGNLIERVDSYQKVKINWIYDENDNEVEFRFYSNERLVDNKISEYNSIGNKEVTHRYEGDGELFLTYKFVYDEKNNLTKENVFNSYGTLEFKVVYKYDEKGNKIEDYWYESDGSQFRKNKYKFDTKENMIEHYVMSDFGEDTYMYEYDLNGNILELVNYDENGIKLSKTSYRYDINNNLIEEINHYFNPQEIIKTTYQYDNFDEYNNFLKKIIFVNDQPKTIVELQITYH
jgi:hypothetical protein